MSAQDADPDTGCDLCRTVDVEDWWEHTRSECPNQPSVPKNADTERPRECPHCHNSDGLYKQESGSWACLDCYWDQDDVQHNDGDDLGREYGRKMFAPIELTPEDEDKVANLLQHNDGYRPEDISVDESQWHGTPFARDSGLNDEIAPYFSDDPLPEEVVEAVKQMPIIEVPPRYIDEWEAVTTVEGIPTGDGRDGPGTPQWDAECQEFGCEDDESH